MGSNGSGVCTSFGGGAASRAVIGPLMVLLLSACASPYDPFQIPEADLRQRVQTIALLPFGVAPDVGDRERLAPLVEALVLERFERSGFRVLPMATMEAVWLPIAAEVGPIYDAKTGRVNGDRWDVAMDLAVRELVAEHGVDALLDMHIESVGGELAMRTEQYCGVERAAYWPAEGFGFFDRATLVLVGCLDVTLYDIELRRLYGIRHALESYTTYLKQTRAVKPIEERFTDPAILGEAVEHTIGPLAGERPEG